MTREQARQITASELGFGYLGGRALKINLEGDSLDPWLYDRDNGGDGTAEAVITRLRETGAIDSADSAELREAMTAEHAFRYPTAAEFSDLIGEVVADFDALMERLVKDGIPKPRDGMTGRHYLNWASDQALAYYDQGEATQAVLLFLILVETDPRTAWIATHPMTPTLMRLGIAGGRSELEYMMKGFAAR